MDYDRDKVDAAVLALLWLTAFPDGPGLQAWKGFDWDALNRLHESGFIGDPKSKAKSVILTERGAARAEARFQQHFGCAT